MAKGSLTKRQLSALNRHKQHHTQKHMDVMVKAMIRGNTFAEAHRKAIKKVGR
jgi:hypothetical protein